MSDNCITCSLHKTVHLQDISHNSEKGSIYCLICKNIQPALVHYISVYKTVASECNSCHKYIYYFTTFSEFDEILIDKYYIQRKFATNKTNIFMYEKNNPKYINYVDFIIDISDLNLALQRIQTILNFS